MLKVEKNNKYYNIIEFQSIKEPVMWTDHLRKGEIQQHRTKQSFLF